MPGLDLNALLTGGASAVVVLAVVISLLLRGQLVPGWAYNELKARNGALEAQIPANTAAIQRAVDALAVSDARRLRFREADAAADEAAAEAKGAHRA